MPKVFRSIWNSTLGCKQTQFSIKTTFLVSDLAEVSLQWNRQIKEIHFMNIALSIVSFLFWAVHTTFQMWLIGPCWLLLFLKCKTFISFHDIFEFHDLHVWLMHKDLSTILAIYGSINSYFLRIYGRINCTILILVPEISEIVLFLGPETSKILLFLDFLFKDQFFPFDHF